MAYPHACTHAHMCVCVTYISFWYSGCSDFGLLSCNGHVLCPPSAILLRHPLALPNTIPSHCLISIPLSSLSPVFLVHSLNHFGLQQFFNSWEFIILGSSHLSAVPTFQPLGSFLSYPAELPWPGSSPARCSHLPADLDQRKTSWPRCNVP